MRAALLVAFFCGAVAMAAAPEGRPAASPTREPSRSGPEYLVQKAGSVWTFDGGKSRSRVEITGFSDWRSYFSYSLAGRSGSGVWMVRGGAWVERAAARGEQEAVVLPATMTRGTHWTGPASIERGGGGQANFEVVALDAIVELPDGSKLEQCLAVLEMGEGPGALTHYYAPNMGKVAVATVDGWLYRLSTFRPGGRAHAH